MSKIGDNIANAVIPEGLSPDDLPGFIVALTGHNNTAVASIPGVTPEITQAGTVAMLNTYVQGFQHVWTAAACFVALASIGKFIPLVYSYQHPGHLLIGILVSAFLFDPQHEFNNHIDAPVEEKSKLYDADA